MRPLVLLAVLLSATVLGGAAAQSDDPPLRFVLVFHYNQNIVPYARAADDIIYRDLTELFLRHPNLNHTIHVSGVLLDALQWMDPVFLQMLREGSARGSFEILGSTHAQSLLWSLRSGVNDTTLNENQLETHRDRIAHLLGVEPVGFWNAERVWSQEFVTTIANAGYDYTFIEDHIQARAPLRTSEHLVRETRHGDDRLVIFNDDKEFLRRFDNGVDSGNWEPTFDYLRRLHAEPGSGKYVVVYAQDAETSGLWDFEGGSDPAEDLRNLDAFFTRVESTPWLRMITPRQFLDQDPPSEEVTPIPKGAADWMGRDRWFEEQDDPNLETYRRVYQDAFKGIQEVEGRLAKDEASDASRKLLGLARHALAAHQYEFADAAHQNNSQMAEWELVRSAFTLTEAARRALAPSDRAGEVLDVNKDGMDDILIHRDGQLYVFSPLGGRLVYWFDLARGIAWTGLKEFTYYGERGSNEARHVRDLVGGKDVYPWLASRTGKPELFEHVFRIRRASFTDTFTIGDQIVLSAADALAAHRFHENGSVTFTYDVRGAIGAASSSFLRVAKTFTFLPEGPHASYEVTDERLAGAPGRQLAPPLDVKHHVEHCLAPDGGVVQLGGLDTIGFDDGRPLLLDVVSKQGLDSAARSFHNLATGVSVKVQGGASLRAFGGLHCVLLNVTTPLGALRPGTTAGAVSSLHGGGSDVRWIGTVAGRVPSFVRAAFVEKEEGRVRVPFDGHGGLSMGAAGTPMTFDLVWDPIAGPEPPATRASRVPGWSFVALVAAFAAALFVGRQSQ